MSVYYLPHAKAVECDHGKPLRSLDTCRSCNIAYGRHVIALALSYALPLWIAIGIVGLWLVSR